MTINTVFYTQLASIISFIIAIFVLYRTLVSHKDSVIELLKERLKEKEDKIKQIEDQSPDSLTTSLSQRIEITISELERLKSEKNELLIKLKREQEKVNTINDEQNNLKKVKANENIILNILKSERRLKTLHKDLDWFKNTRGYTMDEACPDCGAPVKYSKIYEDIFEYECGAKYIEGKEWVACSQKSVDN